MGSFYVSICVSDLSAAQLENWLKQQPFPSYLGPTECNWTCLVSEPLDRQDSKTIDAFGFILTAETTRKAVAVLNHDDDILTVDIYENGQKAGSYNSCPGYFKRNTSPEDLKPKISSPEAFARVKPGVATDDVADVLTSEPDRQPWDIHDALVRLLGLPEYSVGMGFRYVTRGESSAAWTFVAGVDGPKEAADS